MICKHENFGADVNVNRLTDGDEDVVAGYIADLTIRCVDCGQAFEFIGLEGGLMPDRPTCGWTRERQPEARLPIRPAFNRIEAN